MHVALCTGSGLLLNICLSVKVKLTLKEAMKIDIEYHIMLS